MESIPQFLRPFILFYLDLLLLWFSDHVYEKLLPLFGEHLLVKVAETVDLEPIEAACAGFHKNNGMGSPVTHPVRRMVRVLLVRYLYNKSLRETEAHIRENMVAKWFAGYALANAGPDHSTISRFENYLLDHHPRLYFDTVLSQVRVAFPARFAQPHLADTFAVLADAQMETLTGRLRHGAARLLLALHGQRVGWFEQVSAGIEMDSLLDREGEKPEFLLAKAEKQARLEGTVRQVVALLEAVASLYPRAAPVKEAERFLRDVLEKEIELTRDEAGAIIAVRAFSQKERGSYRPTTATDPDATIRNHGPRKRDNGYNAHVLATTDFVVEVQAATGSQPDAAGLVPLLDELAAHQGYRPQKVVYDQAAGDGKTIAAVHEASAGETQLVVKPVQRGKKKEGARLGPLDCTIVEVEDEETGEPVPALVCPGGQTTTTRYRASSGVGWTYRVPAAACAECPLREACRGTAVHPRRYRQWFIADSRKPLLAALAYAETEAFKEEMRLRPQVERVIAILVLHNGARRARFRGRRKVDFQLKMCATAANLKRWITLLDPRKRRKKPRGSAAQAVLRLVGER